jgi:hypothetical protein
MDAGWISMNDDYRFIGVYEGERIRLPSVAEAAPDTITCRGCRCSYHLR